MSTIEDGGSGSGKQAGVGSKSRLWEAAEVYPAASLGSVRGAAAYAWAPAAAVTLTTTGESGVLSLKNTDAARLLLIQRILITLGKSTGGNPGDVVAKIYQNPSTGTLFSGGTAVNGADRNFGQSQLPPSVSFSGAEGSTITNGTLEELLVLKDAFQYSYDDGGIVLALNNSIAVSVTPPASNTSMKAYALILGRYLSKDEITL